MAILSGEATKPKRNREAIKQQADKAANLEKSESIHYLYRRDARRRPSLPLMSINDA